MESWFWSRAVLMIHRCTCSHAVRVSTCSVVLGVGGTARCSCGCSCGFDPDLKLRAPKSSTSMRPPTLRPRLFVGAGDRSHRGAKPASRTFPAAGPGGEQAEQPDLEVMLGERRYWVSAANSVPVPRRRAAEVATGVVRLRRGFRSAGCRTGTWAMRGGGRWARLRRTPAARIPTCSRGAPGRRRRRRCARRAWSPSVRAAPERRGG
jgi:hypothetical protein